MTKQVMRDVEYEGAYMFNYSPRPNTRAWNTLADDVPDEEKTRRLQEIIALQNEIAARKNLAEIGTEHTVLVEGRSKKDATEWKGRTDTNKMVIFPRMDAEVGEHRRVRINRSNSATLFAELVDSPTSVGGGGRGVETYVGGLSPSKNIFPSELFDIKKGHGFRDFVRRAGVL